MEDGGLILKPNDERRIDVLNRLSAGILTGSEAATLLGLSDRQTRRLAAAYRDQGVRGVIHGNRGRPPAQTHPDDLRDRLRALAAGPYAGVNHTHLAELLAEREGIDIPRSTLSDILRESGARSPRPQRRRALHRSRRERYPQEGMLLQIDASNHHWLEGRGPRMQLLGAIDDATGKIVALRFHPVEDAAGYFLLLRQICGKVGVPHALYSDRHGVFWPTNPTNKESIAEELAGRRSTTQFGRAMAELGIQLIPAYSPQAKGRIERLWGTLQDRLVAELRLRDVCAMEDANAFLADFVARHNSRFSVVPAVPGRAYRPKLKAAELDRVLCFKNERVVSKDNTVRVDGVLVQILPGPNRLGYTRATVTVHESLGHRYSVYLDGRFLASKIVLPSQLLTPKARPRVLPKPVVAPAQLAPPVAIPDANHPWRRYPDRTKSSGS